MSETLLEMTRGDHASFDVVVRDSAGLAINISGATFWFTAKSTPTDADPGVFQKTSAGGAIVIVDAPTGKARVDIVPADTSALTASRVLFWDLQMKDSAAKYQTVATLAV